MMLVGILAAQRVAAPAPANILTNGTFDNASGWTLESATIGGGVLTWQVPRRGQSQRASHALDVTVPAGSTVRVTGQRTAALDQIQVSVGNGGAILPVSSGNFSVEFTAGGSSLSFLALDNQEDGGTLDNVTVQVLS